MSKPPTPFHLAYFLAESHVQSWGRAWSGNVDKEWMNPDLYVFVARELERACFDYILMEDNVYVPDAQNGKMDIYLERGLSCPRRDPMIVAPYMLQATKHIGIVPTVSTFAMHPFLLARMISSLDQLSNGRAGWNIVTGSSDRAVQNFGFDNMMEHDERYRHAAEFTDVANALWDSWDADAIVADKDTGVLVDPAKVRTVDFEGEWFKSRGPLNTGPAPQGRPVVAQAGSSPKGREFAARYADTIVAEGHNLDYARKYREEVRELAASFGRNPDDIKLLMVISPIIGESEAEAAEKLSLAKQYNLDNAAGLLARFSKITSIDFGQFPLDAPLSSEDLSTNGSRQTLVEFVRRNEGRTLRQATADMHTPDTRWVGTGRQVAERMRDAIEHVGGDGFLLAGLITRRYIVELVDGLVPELQQMGCVRTAYTGRTLRENLREF
ncbi:NtaA/DmoA family FMN-dependent monooxygenase [Novosphingobium sp. BL-52-GroH]|uniref:NtaA/DmoA family FMN-dependent monooxygenase n=1 Tax=Novosphingobium sp. BL-52-GroH TaxID=3349877 RepID=UPI00384EE386